jgi:hypothetical protein
MSVACSREKSPLVKRGAAPEGAVVVLRGRKARERGWRHLRNDAHDMRLSPIRNTTPGRFAAVPLW